MLSQGSLIAAVLREPCEVILMCHSPESILQGGEFAKRILFLGVEEFADVIVGEEFFCFPQPKVFVHRYEFFIVLRGLVQFLFRLKVEIFLTLTGVCGLYHTLNNLVFDEITACWT